MDEYECLEEDLEKLYDQFMIKFRNQAYLEQLLEDYNRAEQDKTEVSQLYCITRMITFVFMWTDNLVRQYVNCCWTWFILQNSIKIDV